MISFAMPLPPKNRGDHELEHRVISALLTARFQWMRFRHVHVGVGRTLGLDGGHAVEVHARDGRVILTGSLKDDAEKELLQRLVARVPGVLQVFDQLAIEPTRLANGRVA